MVLAAGGLTWLSLAAGTSEIWPINFVWMCFPMSALGKVDGVATCPWVRHSIIHHLSIHCFIDVSLMFQVFSFMFHHFMIFHPCIALLFLFLCILCWSQAFCESWSQGTLAMAWAQVSPRSKARKLWSIDMQKFPQFLCQGGSRLCRHWGCVQESWLRFARKFVKKHCIANFVNLSSKFLKPVRYMREELRMKPSFLVAGIVLELENLCNFWGIPWAQIVPYGRSIGTAPSIHLAKSYPVRGVASCSIWALYDFCFGNLSKHACPSPSL